MEPQNLVKLTHDQLSVEECSRLAEDDGAGLESAFDTPVCI